MRPGYRVPPVTRPRGCHVPVHQPLLAQSLFSHQNVIGRAHTVIEPVPKAVEAMFDEIFCCSKVEPRIDCVVSVAAMEDARAERMTRRDTHSWMMLSNPAFLVS